MNPIISTPVDQWTVTTPPHPEQQACEVSGTGPITDEVLAEMAKCAPSRPLVLRGKKKN